MTTAQIEAGTLTANRQDRIVSGLLLPYGEVGNTNLGKFTVAPGVVTIPADVTVLAANTDHSREHPVARFLTAVDTAAGLVASFVVGKNPEGDALLAEIESDSPTARRNLSVEVADTVIRKGQLLAGKLFGAAFVAKGAFPSASLMAADVGTLPTDPPPAAASGPVVTVEKTSEEFTDENGLTRIRETVTTTTIDGSTTTIDTTTTITDPTTEQDPAVPAATVPNTLAATTATTDRPLSLRDMAGLLFAANQGTLDDTGRKALQANNGASMFAALSDVKFDGTGGLAPTITQPQWIGEAWSALHYRQQVLPLFAHENLTSLTLNGFKWTTKPAGGDWLGNKGNVPSNTLVVAPVTGSADRYAIGHDIAREFVDFNVPGFFESYTAAVTEDYARWADGKVATKVLAGATALAGDALSTLPGATGGTIGSAASAIIDGATALVTAGTLPTFALVATALWKQMVKMPQSNVIGYLNAALGLEEGSLEGFIIRPSASIAAGKVLVGAREAVTVYELPGVPIRVDALDLARGGVDKAAFGYAGVVVNDAAGLQLVTAATV
ncbi:hypothetical protein [Cryobacterium luteum]|uniref:Uncharacterized protein n=1 Tax=Cryobacterium luteum TaxID=1424661 RepID=A0A1H8AUJ7_9MICO|nr:hypothetical protein [Cryobacterium luteum]TFB88619.1 hypothetical protein E3O10_12635 [Cryobacterium luteum]SEM73469.1 hypothetical protein SAMN05216281_101309 [Cryobacterium luteum]